MDSVADHPNLTLHTGARALRLRFAGARCTGVEVAGGVIEAGKEIVLSAGTIESPKLLLLSGIGPAADLAALGIDRLVDLPGVGANLHDHLIAPVIFASPKPIPPVVKGSRTITRTCSGAAGRAWRCPTPSRSASTCRCTTPSGWTARARPTRSTAG